MSFLNRVEEWIVNQLTYKPTLQPIVDPPSDDGLMASIVFAGFLLIVAGICGHCLAH